MLCCSALQLFILRKFIEHELRVMGLTEDDVYFCSLSSATVVYKGQLTPEQVSTTQHLSGLFSSIMQQRYGCCHCVPSTMTAQLFQTANDKDCWQHYSHIMYPGCRDTKSLACFYHRCLSTTQTSSVPTSGPIWLLCTPASAPTHSHHGAVLSP